MSQEDGIVVSGTKGTDMPRNGGTRAFFGVEGDIPVGVWFAIVGKAVVASGDNAKDVYRRAKAAFPGKEIFIARLPPNKVMLL
jgi:hypothetical protein